MDSEPKSRSPDGADLTFREALSDALRYWEPRRIVYNAVLVLVVLGSGFLWRPLQPGALSFDTALGLFILAVLANISYCAAYVVDLSLQYSSFRDGWRRRRWYLLIVGILFASALAFFIAMGIFVPGLGD